MVKLRSLEPEDLDFLYNLENDESVWEISETQKPFSRDVLRKYLENAHLDIYQTRQVRLVILFENQPVGCIDLYDFDPKNKRVTIGIVVLEAFRLKKIASQALSLIYEYAFSYLDVHQLIAYIPEDNQPSIALFQKEGFVSFGVLKDWLFFKGEFKNVLLYHFFKEQFIIKSLEL
ncbi:MAG: GNAT family N-acetyltransferase [Capnocytophaga sp.]|nr:GNAT family N-acetyltransferase [Capnocytophaga sp.]